jgi:hypothetical protein
LVNIYGSCCFDSLPNIIVCPCHNDHEHVYSVS